MSISLKRKREELEELINSNELATFYEPIGRWQHFLFVPNYNIDDGLRIPYDDFDINFFLQKSSSQCFKSEGFNVYSSNPHHTYDKGQDEDPFSGLEELVPLGEISGGKLNLQVKSEKKIERPINYNTQQICSEYTQKAIGEASAEFKLATTIIPVGMSEPCKRQRKTWPAWRTALFTNATSQLMDVEGYTLDQLKPLKIRDVMMSMTNDEEKQRELKSLDSRTIGIKLQKFRDKKRKEHSSPFRGLKGMCAPKSR